MELGLENSRVLITGSSRGIGHGIASSFLEEGAIAVLTGRDEKDLTAAQEILIGKHGADHVETYAGNLGESTVRSGLYEYLAPRGLDHLVCNIGSGRSVPAFQENDEEWRRMLDINIVQAAGVLRQLRSLLVASAQRGRNTSVTFIGSICGMEALGCPLPYASAKAALWAYAKNLVQPLAKDDIRVNQVTPGNILFPGSTWENKLDEDEASVQQMLEKEVAMRRLGTVQEVSDAVVFLASKQAAFITGANLVVDGGQTRGL